MAIKCVLVDVDNDDLYVLMLLWEVSLFLISLLKMPDDNQIQYTDNTN